MTRQLQFSINELMAITVVGAVAAWLVSMKLGVLVPASLAMVFGVAYRKKSDFPLPLLMFGGAGVGIAFTISAVLTYMMLFQTAAFRPVPNIALVIPWLVTGVIFWQFRKMIISKPQKSTKPASSELHRINEQLASKSDTT